uniref:Uncharacterized protein n=1 Tax=Aegilops tauschii subsp. strangulata TaxID=200361 RepID=A0A453M356_AEGTS
IFPVTTSCLLCSHGPGLTDSSPPALPFFSTPHHAAHCRSRNFATPSRRLLDPWRWRRWGSSSGRRRSSVPPPTATSDSSR